MRKKKEILFVMNNLNVGGAEKALVSLLQVFDYEKYNVDLLLFKKEGIFLKQVPQQVIILKEPVNYRYFDMSFSQVVRENFFNLKWSVIWQRIQFKRSSKKASNPAEAEQFGWKPLSKTLKPLSKQYDVAIGFLEKNPNYFVIDKVHAKKKIGFIMNDYNKLNMNKTLDNYYFSKLDYIVQDSEGSRKVMVENFPQIKNKFKVVKSRISTTTVHQLAQEKVTDLPEGFKIVSVGRLTYQKGYDLAIEAIKILADKNLDFKWIILGDGEEKVLLVEKVVKYNLEQKVFFLGIKENHYPYVYQADIFLHTARFEGFGIVIQEAKILIKPIVLTNFNIASTHIENNVNGFIAEMDPNAIAEKLALLILDQNLRNKFSKELGQVHFGSENEIVKLYTLIEN